LGLAGHAYAADAVQVVGVPPNTERTEPSVPPSDATVLRLAAAGVSLPQTAPASTVELVESNGRANFASGSDQLTPEAVAKLDAYAASLRQLAIQRVLVAAHTDAQRLVRKARRRFGTNQRLSEARAARIAEYLESALQLPEGKFAIQGFGASRPIAGNDSAVGRAMNRRAELTVWAEQPPGAPAEPIAPAPAAPILTSVSSCIGDQPDQLPPLRITIDGKPLDPRDGANEADRQRCVDVALARADLQVRYDPLETAPSLNAIAIPQNAVAGQAVHFSTYTNYPRFIERAEIRLFAADQSTQQTPLAIVPVAPGGSAEWTAPPARDALLRVRSDLAKPHFVTYVLRVYDHHGHFDETRARRLDLLAYAPVTSRPAEVIARELEQAAYGENTLILRNIPVNGGAVTVSGSHVPPGNRVFVQGLPIPVDADRHFVARQILPRGPQQVTVKILNDHNEGLEFTRNLSIAVDDTFFVALADFTAGKHSNSGPIELVSGDPGLARHEFVDGHLAFYYKGLVKGDWLLTAAADSQDQPLRNLFSNFASKDSTDLLRRIDPNRYYPVYGDDSTTVQDAPTAGKFYVRLEKGDSSILWGDFQTHLTGTDFLQYSRTLYGLSLRYRSAESTSSGEKQRSVDAFWAEPGTLASRQEFRGTGGSVYYLQNQDVSVGSEQLWVQVRDRDSGIVIASTQLVPAQDYDVNYMQGRILLHSPLATTANSATIVHSGGLDGDPLYLVVTYEYVPDFSSPDSLALGGHASQWFGDHWLLGISDFHQGDPGEQQDLRGIDGTWRYMPGTYIKSEYAHSEGVGSPTLTSITGGLSFDSLATNGAPANAERIEAAVDLAEVTDTLKGKANIYYQDRGANFSGPGQLTPGVAVRQDGAAVNLPVNATTQVVGKFDSIDSTLQTVRSGEIGVDHKLDEHWRIEVGARVDDRETEVANASPILSQNGDRTDVAVTVGYQSTPTKPAVGATPPAKGANPTGQPGWDLYGFVQDTVERTDTRPENDRAGLGGSYQVSKDLRLGAEASDGSLGFGAKLSSDYHVDDHSNVYLNYTLAADQPDALYVGRAGSLTTGTRYRYDDTTSVYAEERAQTGTGPDGLTQAYGVDFAPSKHWTYGLKFENGTISDPLAGDLSVRAIAASFGYTREKIKYSGALEWRQDDSSLTGASRTELTRNSLTYQVDPDWRLLGTLNWSQTDGAANTTLNASYHEIVFGAAWRPVQNDRWNSLLKLTLLEDEPSAAQIASPGNVVDYAQQSRVFDIDTNYQTTSWLSVGVKYAIRTGELKPTATPGGWYASQAQLWVLRGDMLFPHQWDAMLELRRLSVLETDDCRAGVLAGIYRHLGDHLKIGVGYNFTDYSDNLTDVGYRSRGFFLNTIGKF
jgi:outer membrane protein OmpA-like peptidoglycan-associated protein